MCTACRSVCGSVYLSACLCVIPRQRHHHTQPTVPVPPRSTAYSPADGDGSAGGSRAPVIAPLRTCTMLLAAAAAAVVGVCCGGFAKGANSQMVREGYLLTAPRIFHNGNPAEHTLTHGGAVVDHPNPSTVVVCSDSEVHIMTI